jgi:NAD+ kinase
MTLFLYYGEYTAKEDVDIINSVLKRNGHTISDSFSDCDLILSLGGDGTLLKAAKLALQVDKPLAGINCGRLGYLCFMKQEQIEDFDRLFGDSFISEKPLLSCELNGTEYTVVNDFVVGTTKFGKTVDLSLMVDGHFRYTMRGDGLIVCTPVGSTAYNLSAFGPLLDDDTHVLAITPICSHNRDIQPLIIPDNKEVTVSVNKDDAVIYADGEHIGSISDRIRIRKAQNCLKLYVRSKDD